MFKYLFFFLTQILLFASCTTDNNKSKKGESAAKEFNQFSYVYHFDKHELEESQMEPSAYRPRVFDITGKVQAKLYSKDTLIRFVYRSTSGKWKSDSTVELLRLVKLGDKGNSLIPTELLGCRLIGVYNSLNEDVPDNFYQCFYRNENGDLLRVVHLYKPGNVSMAFFYTNRNFDPTDRYRGDIAQLLSVQRPLNLSDTVNIKLY